MNVPCKSFLNVCGIEGCVNFKKIGLRGNFEKIEKNTTFHPYAVSYRTNSTAWGVICQLRRLEKMLIDCSGISK